MYITLLQITQMLVGMWITIKAVLYQMDGQECHVNKTNSVLGLLMYASYFILFSKLFVDHYLLGQKAKPAAMKKEKSIVRAVSSKVLQAIESDDDSNQAKESSEDAARARKRAVCSKVVDEVLTRQGLQEDDDSSGQDQAKESDAKKEQ